jgi:hypothetical protein
MTVSHSSKPIFPFRRHRGYNPGMSQRASFLIAYLVCMGIAMPLALYAAFERYSGRQLPLVQFILSLVFAGIAGFLRVRRNRCPEQPP